MKTDKLLIELEQLVEQTGYTIRKERGTFRGDHCIVEGDNLVVLNKNKPPQQQMGLLARVLKDREMDDIYIKPALRKVLEEMWDRFDAFEDSKVEELDIDLE